MDRILQHPLGPLAAVLTALVVVVGLAQLTSGTQAGAQSTGQVGRAPIERATLVCPEPSGSRVTVVSPPGDRGAGRAQIRTLDRQGGVGQLGTITQPGTVWTGEPGRSTSTAVVRAQGSVAAGLEVEQLATPATGAVGDLSGRRCTRPGTSFWFVTDGVALQRSATLYLVNVSDRPVSVNVAVYGGQGPVDPAAGRGVTVGPHSRTSVRLAALAPQARQAALHVQTRGGRVLAALRTRAGGGKGAQRGDWVPRTQAPRRELVVPGLMQGPGPRRLLLAAPGGSAARARVRLVTTEGTHAPQGTARVRVPPHSVVSVNLAQATSQWGAGAVRVTADVPVTAAAALDTNAGLAYVSAVPPLDGGAVLGGGGYAGGGGGGQGGNRGRGGAGTSGLLLLSAPRQTGGVEVTLLRPDGSRAGSSVLRIPAGYTVRANLSPESMQTAGSSDTENYGVVVTPAEESGSVYGVRMLRQQSGGKTLVAALPLRTSRTSVRVPNAEQSLGVVLPDRRVPARSGPAASRPAGGTRRRRGPGMPTGEGIRSHL